MPFTFSLPHHDSEAGTRLDSSSTLAEPIHPSTSSQPSSPPPSISHFPHPPNTPSHLHPPLRPPPFSFSSTPSSHPTPQSSVPLSLLSEWKWDLLSLLLGLASIAGLAILLHHYEGQPVPHFGPDPEGSLSLNTVVAILTTASKAFLAHPLLGAVAQQRWLYFARRPRKLGHWTTFEVLAKGGMGVGKGIWDLGSKNIAGVTPLITGLGFALEPFSQQLIGENLTLVPVQGPGATVGRPVFWSDGQTGSGIDIVGTGGSAVQSGFVSAGMTNAVWNGIFNSDKAALSLSLSCPGGNCTFGSYQSLAVCSRVANVSEQLTSRTVFDAAGGFNITNWCFADGNCFGGQSWSCDYTAGTCGYVGGSQGNLGPNVIQVSPAVSPADSTQPMQNSSTPHLIQYNNSIALTNISSPIVDAFVLVQNGIDSTDSACEFGWGPWCFESSWGYSAWEFALEWCVQNYSMAVVNGQTTLQPLGSSGNFSISEVGGNLTSSAAGIDGELYGVSFDTHTSLQDYFAGLFNGSAGKADFPNWDSNWWATSTAISAFIAPWNLTWSGEWADYTGFEVFLTNIATSMTTYIQIQSPSQSQLPSTVYHTTPVVYVRWPWIMGLAVFAGAVTAVLAATIAEQCLARSRHHLQHRHPQGHHQNRRDGKNSEEETPPLPTCKDSGLAPLHALDPQLGVVLGGVEDETRLEERDRGRWVRLEFVSGDGWRLREGEREGV